MGIVRLLLSWYRQQTVQVKWDLYKASGVLCPYLFSVYVDELSDQLGLARVRCTVGNMVANHLLFADDICVSSGQPQY